MAIDDNHRDIWHEVRRVTNRPKLRAKDILGWDCCETRLRERIMEDRIVVFLPDSGLYVAITGEYTNVKLHGDGELWEVRYQDLRGRSAVLTLDAENEADADLEARSLLCLPTDLQISVEYE